jgi:hypothetical protein
VSCFILVKVLVDNVVLITLFTGFVLLFAILALAFIVLSLLLLSVVAFSIDLGLLSFVIV